MRHKIKILKDTPFDRASTMLSIAEFRERYRYLISPDNSDEFVINYLTSGYLNDYHGMELNKWFEVIKMPENNFRVGDWVWHETLQKAFVVMIHTSGKEWKPNYVSFEAANEFVDIYKRKATQAEINYYDLVYYGEKTVLIGQYKSYYYNNVWKELIGISKLILQYTQASKDLSQISVLVNATSEIEHSYTTTLSGITVGCKHIPHQEIISIAKQLKLIP